ncbi:TraR/DksA C4-type zinc finger protein [Pseudomonas fluorescens]|uniref:TraR/DksA C4-type zinc finger protein n=1 Tax=Pseudomonas fluorescens TaxID=294 RepID=UPI0007D0A586|nr:TraR/DksA C4-type zinc finger protein [Pseudomonas fluorescens]
MEATDEASLLEALHNDSALAAHLAQRETLTGPSAEFCQAADCDMPIPEDRRQAVEGVQHCALCQMRRERNQF